MAHKHDIFLDSDEDDVPLATRIKPNSHEVVTVDDADSDESIDASQITVVHISPHKTTADCVQISSESTDDLRCPSPRFSPDPFYHQSPDPFYDDLCSQNSFSDAGARFSPRNSPKHSPLSERLSPGPELPQSCSQSSSINHEPKAKKPAKPRAKKPQPSMDSGDEESQPCSQSSQVGRAPIGAISKRDCSAVIPESIFESKFFTREELKKTFSEFEVRFTEATSFKFANTITWLRETKDEVTGETSFTSENQVLALLKMDQVVSMVDQYLRKTSNGFRAAELISLEATDSEADLEEVSDGRVDFLDFTRSISRVYPQSSIILILTGMPAYFRRLKTKEHQKFRDAIRGTQSRKRKSVGLPVIKERDLIDACVDLDMKSSSIMPHGCHVRTVQADKADDIATLVASFSKSVAEAPYKMKQQEARNMAWYAENDSKFAVDIKDIPQDIERLWKKQLEQFPKVSREVAEAIGKVYPNPLSLIDAYTLAPKDSCASLLENIRVGKGSRKVGHEISRKLCTFFKSYDPNEFL